MDSLWATTNPVFRQYALCSGLLGLKLLSMAFLTAKQRFANKVSVIQYMKNIEIN